MGIALRGWRQLGRRPFVFPGSPRREGYRPRQSPTSGAHVEIGCYHQRGGRVREGVSRSHFLSRLRVIDPPSTAILHPSFQLLTAESLSQRHSLAGFALILSSPHPSAGSTPGASSCPSLARASPSVLTRSREPLRACSTCTLVAHEDCLLTWVAAQQASSGKGTVTCPQCKIPYEIQEVRRQPSLAWCQSFR